MLLTSDVEKNRAYWAHTREFLLFSFEHDYQKRSLADEVDAYLSLEERGYFTLSDALGLLITGEKAAFEHVIGHAMAVLKEALIREKFIGYRQAWGLEVSLNDEQQKLYRLKGKIGCNWKLYLGSLLLNQEEPSYLDNCIALLPLVFEQLRKCGIRQKPKNTLDDFWHIWAIGRSYAEYVSCYEENVVAGRSIAAVNQPGSLYMVSRFLLGDPHVEKQARKYLERHFYHSIVWHQYDVDYPWWRSFAWAAVYTREFLHQPQLEDVLRVFKGTTANPDG